MADLAITDEGLWQQASPLVLPSAAATQSLAALLGQTAACLLTAPEQQFALPQAVEIDSTPGLVILLAGGLGSGKTTFVQGLGQGLEIPEPIDSPSFVLVQEYRTGRIPLFHCDLYRLGPTSGAHASEVEASALEDLGLEELWGQVGITAIEWPQYLPYLPPTYLWLQLEPHLQAEGSRLLHVKGRGLRTAQLWQQVLSQLPQRGTKG
ncbi:tRNA (adenosine(37)-N6)-threonylcarbamoyltransferase complex ATPase subunit type 1 TsaE [Synechococcus sp. W70.1]|uniref:tRNA (adenosine(37)-N6)-threonylcarbamoyltransferase complex ATPase subunit type 1 TsaE n=1 Tax=Synechococcus sp. W70.1 TaxID=2964534 RepID=UPI0039C37813